jgi:hypothetical protein
LFRDLPDKARALVGRFMALPTESKVLVGVLGLSALLFIITFLLVLSPALAGACAVAFVVSLIALVIRLRQQRPVRGWLILAGVSLVLSIVFSSVSGALYGSSDNSGKEAAVSPEPTQEVTQEPTQEPTQEATQEPTVQKRKAAKTVAETTTPATPLREPSEPTTPDYLKKEYTNPQTPEETVLASIERERGAPLSKHQDIQVAVDADQNGCRNIQLNYQTTDPTSIESEMEGFLQSDLWRPPVWKHGVLGYDNCLRDIIRQLWPADLGRSLSNYARKKPSKPHKLGQHWAS